MQPKHSSETILKLFFKNLNACKTFIKRKRERKRKKLCNMIKTYLPQAFREKSRPQKSER